MWISQLLRTFKARYQLAQWLKRQRAMRLDLARLSDHVKRDIGVNNLGAVPVLTWHDAPEAIPTASTRGRPGKISSSRRLPE